MKNIAAMFCLITALLSLGGIADAQTTQTVIITVSWGPAASGNELGYNVYQCVGAGCTGFYRIGQPVLKGTTSFLDTIFNDPGNRTICYRVTAFNDRGESPPTNSVCVTTAPVGIKLLPNAPTNLVIR
jgi:hypothetical protein